MIVKSTLSRSQACDLDRFNFRSQEDALHHKKAIRMGGVKLNVRKNQRREESSADQGSSRLRDG
jgi:hypothetical protein